MAKKNKVNGFSSFLNNPVDFTLVITVLLLLSIGLVMLLSASSPTSLQEYNNSYKYFLRQLVFAVLGLIAMYFISRIDYRIYQKFYKLAWWLSFFSLIVMWKSVSGRNEDTISICGCNTVVGSVTITGVTPYIRIGKSFTVCA